MTLKAFWPRYVLAHQKSGTQWLHLLGTISGVSLLVAAVALRNYWLIAGGLVVGYGCAWFGHFFIEGNKPATFGHPFLSFASDFRMVFCIVTGGMGEEIRRAKEQKEQLDR